VCSVLGIDVDQRHLEGARADALADGLTNVDFRQGDLIEPSTFERIDDSSFDVVLVLDVLEHLTDRLTLLRRLRSLLSAEGRLLLAVPNRSTDYKRWRRRAGAFAYTDLDHKIEYTESSLRAELSEAGFRIRSLERAGYDSFFPGFTALLGAASVRAYRRLIERRDRLNRSRPQNASAFRVVASK
jgi:SAM-dependent methyltransferase